MVQCAPKVHTKKFANFFSMLDWKLQDLGENIRLKIFYKRRSRSRKKLKILDKKSVFAL